MSNKIIIGDYIRSLYGQMKPEKTILKLAKIQFPKESMKSLEGILSDVKEELTVTGQDVVYSSVANYQSMIQVADICIDAALHDPEGVDKSSVSKLIENKRKILQDLQVLTGGISNDEKDPEIIVDEAWKEE